MRWFVLVLLMGCADAVAPEEHPPDPVPVLTFVGVCDHPAVWRLTVDLVNLPPTGIWLFFRTDSLVTAAARGSERFDWSELDPQTGRPLQGATVPLDARGSARVVATCR